MNSAIAPELRAVFLASFTAFCRSYNIAMGVVDWHRWNWRDAPAGVTLQDILLSRYALSVHETVQVLLMEGRVPNLHTIAFANIQTEHGEALAKFTRARFESNGGPTWDAITAAALAFANRTPDADAVHHAFTTRGV